MEPLVKATSIASVFRGLSARLTGRRWRPGPIRALLVVSTIAAAEPVPVDIEGRPTPTIGLAPPALGEPAISEWVRNVVLSESLRHLIEGAESDALRLPYHRRAPSWIQNVAQLHLTDTARLSEETALAERDRRIVEWLMEDEARRRQDTAPALVAASDPAAGEAGTLRWQRVLALIVLFGAFVGVTVKALMQRLRRRQPVLAEAPVRSRRRRSRHDKPTRPMPKSFRARIGA
jgi:hypothetical protein